MKKLLPLFQSQLLANAAIVGFIIGYPLALGLLPGGYDAFYNFLRLPFETTTAPAWVYLLTAPLGLIPWPERWILWSAITLGVTYWAHKNFGNRYWWVPFISLPMLWNLWLGNLEVFPIFGVALGFLVINKKIHPIWWGAGILALVVKPQVSLGLMILISWWILKDLGIKPALWSIIFSLIILLTTVLIWPLWIINWIHTIRSLYPTWWNGSIFPYGLIACLPAIAPIKISKVQRLRLVAAANLLSSPYLALYHCTTLMVLTDRRIDLAVSWFVLAAGLFLTPNWMKISWLLPAIILIIDCLEIFFGYFAKKRIVIGT